MQTGFLTVPLIIIYLEHILIGWLFGFDMGHDSGGFISLPFSVPVFAATVVLDYLLVALFIYALLMLAGKRAAAPKLR
jgi:hypothetical protein